MYSYSSVVIIASEPTISFPFLEFEESNDVLGESSLKSLCSSVE